MTRIATSKAIVVVADDLEESHNIASVRIKDAVVRNGAKLVVIGPLRSELVDFAALWVRTDAGAEGATAAAIASSVAGAPATNDDVAAAVSILKDAPKDNSLVVCAPNPVSAAIAGAMAGGAANLAIALFGAEASNNLVVLPPEANVHGLLDVGVATEGAADPLEGAAAVLLIRDDPTMRLATAGAALAKAATVIVIDNVLSEAAKAAAVVIAEGRAYASTGTYTTADHRIQKLMPAVKPEGDAVSLFEALSALGAALGVELPKTADAALGAIAKLDSAYQPAWDLIIGEGVRRSVAVSAKAASAPVESLSADAGTKIIAARDLYTALDAAAMRHPEAEKLHRYDRIQVSEEDGIRLGISSGDEVTISAGTTAVAAKATVTERVPAGHVFVSSLAQGGKVSQFFGNGHVPAVALARSSSGLTPRVAMPATAAPQSVAAPSAADHGEPGGRVPVETIIGVSDEAKAALNDAGIVWLDEYLDVAASADGRKALSTQTGIDAKQLLEWANRADLMRVPGVTAGLADLLENAGVDTVKELATRNAANLHAKLAEVGGTDAPAASEVADWIGAAKSLPQVITH
ncbi:DUF4332 domain-containing protein [Candidatus Amarobacter glycogenicus]|uniref:DUF4332 domain-containing protein n=1 Tax=Candidatus Amarobacter glycogenicus TaxID=3140699 RepID=UPI003135C993|nr:DUF4332 domain-containing protein [Dehalococcoidia bacterium]